MNTPSRRPVSMSQRNKHHPLDPMGSERQQIVGGWWRNQGILHRNVIVAKFIGDKCLLLEGNMTDVRARIQAKRWPRFKNLAKNWRSSFGTFMAHSKICFHYFTKKLIDSKLTVEYYLGLEQLLRIIHILLLYADFLRSHPYFPFNFIRRSASPQIIVFVVSFYPCPFITFKLVKVLDYSARMQIK